MVFGTDNDITLKVTVDADGAIKEVDKLEEQLEDLESTAKKADAGFSKFERGLIAFGSAASGISAAIGIAKGAFDTLTSAAQSAGDAIELGFKVQGVANSFEQLVGATQDAEEFLKRLEKATLDTVSAFDLQTQANQAVLLGLPIEQFDQLAGAAVKLGNAVGNDALNSIESLVGALGRGSTELLDNLGVTLKAADAQQQYATQLGISVKALTEEQKAQAFREIAIQKVIEKAQTLADVEETAGLAVQQLSKAFEDQVNKAAQAISENEDLGRAISDLAATIEAADFTKFIDFLTDIIELGAQAATAIGTIANTFFNLDQVLADVSGPALIEATTGLGKAFEFIEKGIDTAETEEDLQRLANNFREVQAQISQTLGEGAFDERTISIIFKSIDNLNKKLVEASKAFAELTPKEIDKILNQDIPKALNKTGKAVSLTEKELKKLEKAFDSLEAKVKDLAGVSVLPELTEKQLALAEAFAEGGEAAEVAAKQLTDYIEGIERTPENLERLRNELDLVSQATAELTEQQRAANEAIKDAQDAAKDLGFAYNTLGADLASVFGVGGVAGGIFGDVFEGLFTGAGDSIGAQFGTLLGDFLGTSDLAFDLGIGAELASLYSFGIVALINGIITGLDTLDSEELAFEDGRDRAEAFQVAFAEGVFSSFGISGVADDIAKITQSEIFRFSSAGILDTFITEGFIAAGFFGTKDEGTLVRRAFTDFLNEAFDAEDLALVINGQLKRVRSLIRPEEVLNFFDTLDTSTAIGAQQFESFAGISIPLSLIFDPEGQVGLEQFGAILGANLENLNNLQIAFQEAGLGASDLGAALEEAYLKGQITAQQFLEGQREIENVFTQGIPDGIGLIDQAFSNLIQSAGIGRLVLDALGDVAAEAIEKFGDAASLEQIREELIASGVEAEKVEQLFDAFAAAGITSVEQLKNIGIETAAVIAAQLEGLGTFFDDAIESTGDVRDRIDSIPDQTVKEVIFRITTETDEATEENRDLLPSNTPTEGEAFGE